MPASLSRKSFLTTRKSISHGVTRAIEIAHSSRLSLPLLLILVLLFSRLSSAQYAMNTVLYNQTLATGNLVLTGQVTDNMYLEDIYYPNKYILPTDFYTYKAPNRDKEYTQNVIFNPCEGYSHDCCSDTYGTPEYLSVNSDPKSINYGIRRQRLDDGSTLLQAVSRLPDDQLYIDDSCQGLNLPPGRTDCYEVRLARKPFPILPRCWNRNETVIGDGTCRSPSDGSSLNLCIELGITQTGFIYECGGEFKEDPHCGTFLEIHRPGFADKVSETRLRGLYPSGYRMTVISTTYKGDPNRTICYDQIKQGKFEMWWVQRTRHNLVVERRVPFTVISPECDWDDPNNRYLPYATLYLPDGVTRRARILAGLDPFDPKNLLFTRKRTEGIPAKPGKGMGSTLEPIIPGVTYDSTAVFSNASWHNFYTYSYMPDRPDYTIQSGIIQPTELEQVRLERLRTKRGYRRLEEVPDYVLSAMLAEIRANSNAVDDFINAGNSSNITLSTNATGA